ncbi:MAG: efflux RND transporter periplasmic adaptor subunit [Halieaceae bacterium]
MSKKLLYPLLVLAAAIAVMTLLIISRSEPVGEDFTPPLTTVRVVTTESRAEHLVVRSQGTVQPRTESQLIPEVSGRVVWMSPALVSGGSFSEGEALLRIDDADYRNAVDKGKAALTRAKVEQEHAADELERVEKLHQQKLSSQSQVDEAQRRFRVAEANLVEARINLQQAERDLSRTLISAPYSGRVRREHVDQGQFIARGSEFATIYATDFAEVRLPIAANQLAYLNISTGGQLPEQPSPVTLSGVLGNVQFIWNGELVRTEAEFDSSSRMIFGVARIRNVKGPEMPPLAVGLFVQAEIQGRLVDNVIRLPRTALRDQNQVLVVDAEDRLRFRQVTVSRIEHDEVLIRKGLEAGERVCVSPLQTVVDGMQVQAVESQ